MRVSLLQCWSSRSLRPRRRRQIAVEPEPALARQFAVAVVCVLVLIMLYPALKRKLRTFDGALERLRTLASDAGLQPGASVLDRPHQDAPSGGWSDEIRAYV
jgi:hypothetical protein